MRRAPLALLLVLAGCAGSGSPTRPLAHASATPAATVATATPGASPAASPTPTPVASQAAVDLATPTPAPTATPTPTPTPTATPTPFVLPSGTTLAAPSGVAPYSGGYYVADRLRQQILKFTDAGAASVVAGTGVQGYDGEGVDAATATLSSPHAVHVDAAGNVYFVERSPAVAAVDHLDELGKADNACTGEAEQPVARVRKLATNGKLTTVYTSSTKWILDLCVTPSSTIYMALWDPCGGNASVIGQDPSGGQTTVVDASRSARVIGSLCFDNDQNLYAVCDDQILEYTAQALAKVVLPGAIQIPGGLHDTNMLAVHGGGELYIADRPANRVLHCTPFVGSVQDVLGVGSLYYADPDGDNSLLDPCYPITDGSGTLYVVDNGHHRVVRLPRLSLALGTSFP